MFTQEGRSICGFAFQNAVCGGAKFGMPIIDNTATACAVAVPVNPFSNLQIEIGCGQVMKANQLNGQIA